MNSLSIVVGILAISLPVVIVLVVGGSLIGRGRWGPMTKLGCSYVMAGSLALFIIILLLYLFSRTGLETVFRQITNFGETWVAETVRPKFLQVQAEQATPISPTSTAEINSVPICWDARYIEDITIPKYAQVSPGEKFNKIWQVENIGYCDWEGVELHLVDGVSMDAQVISIPDTKAGDETAIVVEMTAPNQVGRYYSIWRYVTGDTEFGMLTLNIEVVEE